MQKLDLNVRHFVYQQFVLNCRPPTFNETATALDLAPDLALSIFQRLHDNHFFFLDPGTTNIRIANPLSAVPTQFIVQAGQLSYWATCAWDMLGIPAMLHSDAVIRAQYADTLEDVLITVSGGQIEHPGGVVHFPLPVRQWYDDLILT